MNLTARVQAHADQLVDEVADGLHQARLHHYTASSIEVTRERVSNLLDAVLDSLRHASPVRIVQHADAVARDRFHAGFGIDEIQVAVNTVEQALWRLLVRETPAANLADDLGRVGAVLGAAKDQMARTYVQLACREHHPCVDVDALFEAV